MARTGVRVSAIIKRDGRVLLIHRKKPEAEYWVFPGGGVEDFETIEEALVREVKEETNLEVISYKFAFLVPSDNDSKMLNPFYYCEVSNGEARIIGEEKENNSPENYYLLEWKVINGAVTSINLVPNQVKAYLKNL